MTRTILITFIGVGIVGTLQAGLTETYVNPALPLYVLVTVCAIGFLVLYDKK